jgi:eukaryotic-like serine/threonine-protein kinase
LAFSPDGNSIAFYTIEDRTIKRIDVKGGPITTLCAFPGLATPGISWEDNNWIVVGGGVSGVMRVPAAGGHLETLVKVNEGELAMVPQVLPDGDSVLFTMVPFAEATERWDEKAELVVQSLKTGRRKTLLTGAADGRYVSTGHILYVSRGTLFAVPFDGRRLELTGAPVPVVDGVFRAVGLNAAGVGLAQFVVSHNGTLVYVPGPTYGPTSKRSLVIADLTANTESLKIPAGAYETPRLSPGQERSRDD